MVQHTNGRTMCPYNTSHECCLVAHHGISIQMEIQWWATYNKSHECVISRHMVQHTNGNTRWATKQKYECCKDTWYNIQMEIQDERLNKSMNVL